MVKIKFPNRLGFFSVIFASIVGPASIVMYDSSSSIIIVVKSCLFSTLIPYPLTLLIILCWIKKLEALILCIWLGPFIDSNSSGSGVSCSLMIRKSSPVISSNQLKSQYLTTSDFGFSIAKMGSKGWG